MRAILIVVLILYLGSQFGQFNSVTSITNSISALESENSVSPKYQTKQPDEDLFPLEFTVYLKQWDNTFVCDPNL